MIFLITMTIGFSIGVYLMDKNQKSYKKYIDPKFLKRNGLINDLEFEHMKDRNKKQDRKSNIDASIYILLTFIITAPLSIILNYYFKI